MSDRACHYDFPYMLCGTHSGGKRCNICDIGLSALRARCEAQARVMRRCRALLELVATYHPNVGLHPQLVVDVKATLPMLEEAISTKEA